MALAGNIQEFGLADIFQIVSLQQKTGQLTVEGKEGKVSILLEAGFIVGADATFRPIEERLYRTLAHSDAINKFQLKRALETQKKTSQPLWTTLAETKAIDIDTLKTMLSQQIHETIYHVLRWSDGAYRFDPKKHVEYDGNLVNPINTEFLVMEGFRITDEWTEVEKVITSFQLAVRRVPGTPESPENLSGAESKIFSLLPTERTVQELIDMGQLGEFDTCQVVYELVKKNLVEQVPTKIRRGKASHTRRTFVSATDILGKIATVFIGIALLVGVVIGLRYVPKNFSLIYAPDFTGLETVKRLKAQSQLRNLARIVSQYTLYRQKLPEDLAALQDEGFIASRRVLKDPWGSPFHISLDKGKAILRSETVLPGEAHSLSITIAD